ncbi:Choline dehydrogenase [Apiospora arundinis]
MHASTRLLVLNALSLGRVLGSPLLGSLLNPLTGSLETATSGLVEATIGQLKGTLGDQESFDYIVVGGGTGGNTIAYRLAEAGFSVAVIERGLSYEVGKPIVGPAPLGDIIGVGSNPIDSIPTVDYGLVTEPQAGGDGRRIHYTQGKCLGGSSALNFLIYHRPDKGSMKTWADAHHLYSPNNNVRPANATPVYYESDFSANQEHAPLQVSYANWSPSWSSWAAKGFEALGFKLTGAFNQGTLSGYHYSQLTTKPKDQVRSTSADFLYHAKDKGTKGKLTVYLATRGKKIIFDANKKATGVEVGIDLLPSYVLKAKKEVIVSAGAIHSPQLLMLSGIGPAAHLTQHGIKVIADRPGVGQNFSDHVLFGPSYQVKIDTLNKVIGDPVVLAAAIAEYALSQTGPLTSNVAEFLAWERVPASANMSQATRDALDSKAPSWPHIEYFSAAGFIGPFNIPFLDQPKDGKMYSSVLGALVAPFSRGNVSLSSSSPYDAPKVNPNWMTHKADQELAIAIYRRIRGLYETEAIKSVRANTVEYWPGLDKVQTDEQILAHVHKTLMAVYHASCTNRMGRRDDPTAVVDSLARVIGVSGVRVVDASAFALLPPGHPQSVVYALAEKISDAIIRGLE